MNNFDANFPIPSYAKLRRNQISTRAAITSNQKNGFIC
nr:MAG TPA: hypothetical protein [Bacteriophage sp.]